MTGVLRGNNRAESTVQDGSEGGSLINRHAFDGLTVYTLEINKHEM